MLSKVLKPALQILTVFAGIVWWTFLWVHHAFIIVAQEIVKFTQEIIMRLTPVDKSAELEGVEVPYRGATLIVARANNTRFKRVFRQLIKPYKHQMEKDKLDPEVSEELMTAAYAEAILVGWKNFVDIEGKEWAYTKENARVFLTDDPDAFDIVRDASEDMERFMIQEEAEVVKK